MDVMIGDVKVVIGEDGYIYLGGEKSIYSIEEKKGQLHFYRNGDFMIKNVYLKGFVSIFSKDLEKEAQRLAAS